LEVRFDSDGMILSTNNCNLEGLDARFFLHVYTEDGAGNLSANYLGRDFDFLQGPIKRTGTGSHVQCSVQRRFEAQNVKEVVLGQFTLPEGKCCRILWSRNYVIGQ
jgi:hypothetical protein